MRSDRILLVGGPANGAIFDTQNEHLRTINTYYELRVTHPQVPNRSARVMFHETLTEDFGRNWALYKYLTQKYVGGNVFRGINPEQRAQLISLLIRLLILDDD